MSSGSSPPPPPNYAPIAAADSQAAQLNFQLGEEQLAWAQQQFGQEQANRADIYDQLFNLADTANQRSDQQFQWAQQEQANADDQARAVANQQMSIASEQQANAEQDRARYQQEFQPLEDQLVNDANSYASPERKQLEMGRAEAAVGQSMDAQRQAAENSLESFGINPGSLRFSGLDIGARAAYAAATAGAGNQASQQVDATGRALRSEAINVGRGYPGQIAGTYNTALQADSGATNTTNSTNAVGANMLGTPVQWAGAGTSELASAAGALNQSYGGFSTAPAFMSAGTNALGQWGNTLNMGYQNQLASYNASQNQSSGLGSLLGLATMFVARGGMIEDHPAMAFQPNDYIVIPSHDENGKKLAPHEAVRQFYEKGVHRKFSSPEEAKQAMQEEHGIGVQHIEHHADGGTAGDQQPGAIPAPAAPQAPQAQTPPGAVPAGASPTGGQAIDDVPARLTVGEFIVPKDVVSWNGEKFFQDLIAKSRKAKEGAQAKPEVGPAIPPQQAAPQAALPPR